MALTKVTTGTIADDSIQSLKNRNLIINGAMQVAQRGTSKASVGQEYATVDRFRTNGTTGTFTMSQESDGPNGFSYSLKMLSTANITPSAGDLKEVYVSLEGQNLQHLKKGTSDAENVTLSFYVKSNVTGTKTVYLLDKDNTRLISANYTISSSATWEKKTITFSGDTTGAFNNDNGRSLDVHFPIVAGTNYTSGTQATSWAADVATNRISSSITQIDATNDYWQITGVQLEVGDVATPFEHESFGNTLQKCKRYYQKSYDLDTFPGATVAAGQYLAQRFNSTDRYFVLNKAFPVEMRNTPTLTLYDRAANTASINYYNSNTDLVSIASVSGTTQKVIATYLDNNSGSGTDNVHGFHFTADAEL